MCHKEKLIVVKNGNCPKCNTLNTFQTLSTSKFFKIVQCEKCRSLFIATNIEIINQTNP